MSGQPAVLDLAQTFSAAQTFFSTVEVDGAATFDGAVTVNNEVKIGAVLELTHTGGLGALFLPEQSAAPGGFSNQARLYAEDNGSGKTGLVVKWSDGTTEVLASQP